MLIGIRNLLLILSAMICAFFCWFFLITTFYVKTPIYNETELGHRPKPYSSVLWNKEGFGYTNYNAEGFIGDISKESNGLKRILILGDSYMEAWQVPQEKSFASKLSSGLNGEQKKYNLFNAGLSGVDMAHYIAYGNQYINFFHPDLVLIQVSNDDFYEDAVKSDKNAYINIDSSGYPQIIKKQRNIQKSQVKQNDYVNSELETRIQSIKFVTQDRYSNIFPGGVRAIYRSFINTFRKKELSPVIENNNKGIKKNQEVFNKLAMWEIAELKRIYGDIPIILMYIPQLKYTNDGVIRDELDSIRSDSIKEYCDRYGIRLIDMYEPFRNKERDYIFIRGFVNSDPFSGHLNKVGHAVLADVVKEYIQGDSSL